MKADILKVAKTAARKAGKVLMASYGKLRASQIATKAQNDFVTDIDRRSERVILSEIRRHFPDHGILAEESGLHNSREGTVWAVDPLDGTANYIHRFPLFSVSIGVLRGGKLLAGVVYDPLHNELFSAEAGRGSFLNGRRIRVSPVKKLADALPTTGIPFRLLQRFDGYMDSFEKISTASAGLRRGGSAALDLAYVACGRLDGYWEAGLSLWDIAAGSLLVREAGGRVTDLWGGDTHLETGDIIAATRGVHKGLAKITSRSIGRVKK